MSGAMFTSLPFGVPDTFLGYSFFVGDCFFLGLYSLGVPVLFGVALLPLSHREVRQLTTPDQKTSHCCQLFVEPVGFFLLPAFHASPTFFHHVYIL